VLAQHLIRKPCSAYVLPRHGSGILNFVPWSSHVNCVSRLLSLPKSLLSLVYFTQTLFGQAKLGP
jgi:hypothetical protein